MTAPIATRCPACGFEQEDSSASCARCGVVFARFRGPAPRPVVPPGLREPDRQEPDAPGTSSRRFPPAGPGRAARPEDRLPWKLLGGGLLAAVVAHAFAPTRYLLSPLVTLLHEFGHAATAWLLGCPALPAFDFVYGGGVTHHRYFQLPLGALLGAGWIWLGWTFRRNPRTRTLVAAAAGIWLLAVSAEWRRELVIASMGHGGELVLAGVLLWMALTGSGWRRPELERPLGAFAAWFVQLRTMDFAWRLRHDEAFLAGYREGKGGAMMNDLEVVALDLKIWTGLSLEIEQVAGWLLVLSAVTVTLAVLAAVRRERLAALARSLRLLEPTG